MQFFSTFWKTHVVCQLLNYRVFVLLTSHLVFVTVKVNFFCPRRVSNLRFCSSKPTGQSIRVAKKPAGRTRGCPHQFFFWSKRVTETFQGKKLNLSSISVRCTWKVSWKTNYLVRWWRRKAKSQIDQIVFIFELPPHPTFIFSVRTKRNSSTKILFNGFLVYDTFWSEKRLISLSYDWYLIVPRCHIVVKIGLNSDLFYNPSHCFLWTTTRFSVSRLKSELSSL